MKMPLNAKVFFQQTTYRGGEELPPNTPQWVYDKVGLKAPVKEPEKLKKVSKLKNPEVKNGS